MASLANRRPRLDHGLLVGAAVLWIVSAPMPWIVGSTRFQGNIRWTGFDDTGDGAILAFFALGLLSWVRWRGILEEVDLRSRWIPIWLAVAGTCIWIISFRKALDLAWWELEVGARPQLGLLVAGFGAVVAVAGGWLASRTRAEPDEV